MGFYDFGTDARVTELRGTFRAGLAQIRVGQSEADQIVTEARWAFEQHVLLFEQLAERPLASV
jgi:heme oxygenase